MMVHLQADGDPPTNGEEHQASGDRRGVEIIRHRRCLANFVETAGSPRQPIARNPQPLRKSEQ